jgi:drug/metabolite transporter (DMT)-like permease
MLGFLYSLISSLSFGASNVVSKEIISEDGPYQSLAYASICFTILLLLGAVFFQVPLFMPSELIVPYLIQIISGAVAVLALFKAFENGKASIIASLSSTYVIVVVGVAIVFFNEPLSQLQLLGSFIIMVASLVLAIKNLKKHKLEGGVIFLLATVFCWGYYYGFIKIFIPVLGVYGTTFFLEIGIGVLVILYCVFTRKDITFPTTAESLSIALRALLIFLGSLFYNFSVALIGVALTSAITSSSSLFTDVLSYFFLKEKFSIGKYAAMVALVVGLMMIFVG